MLRVLDLFSGIGGFSLGLERAGMRTVGFCEIDEFYRRVLAKHWPDVPCHDDVTTREFQEGEADVICGGFPCQDVSRAGKRAGLSGARSGLYRELVRAIRVVRPRVAILENVAALLSDGMGAVLGDLAESGDCVEWDCVPALAVGAPHERDRVWIVAHADGAWGQQPAISGEDKWLWIGNSIEARPAPSNASDPDGQYRRCGAAGQDRPQTSDGSRELANSTRFGRGEGRQGRPPDSFARIRDEARRNAADPYGARLAFREGLTRDAWEKLTAAERDAFGNVEQSVWPDEPALQGMDDGTAYWVDRVRATGNQVLPQIPELIGLEVMSLYAAAERPQQ